MIRLDCPSCKKDSYSAAVEPFRPCPYCGEVYSGKYGLEKRNKKRNKKAFPFTFKHNGYLCDASIIDFSRDGVGIKIFDNISISRGEVIDLNVNHLFAKAQIRWTYNNPELNITLAGCKILNGNLNLK